MHPSNNNNIGMADEESEFECDVSSITSFSSSSSEVSAASSSIVVTDSVTGKFSNIERKYQLDKVIGTGYNSSVRECVDRTTGQRFAVKSIGKHDPAITPADLHREVGLLREVKHDNIIRLVDTYEDEDFVYLVTDLYSGGELFEKIVQKKKSSAAGCFAEGEASRILHQVLTAVSYLHSHDIVHRDIKAENIVFDSTKEDSTIKLIDFGVSRKHYQDSFEKYMSTLKGTSHFVAPEVLRGKYDKSCDLWSVGVVAFIMLSGHPPFNGKSNKEVFQAVRRGKYNFKSRHWEGVSKEAKDFVRRLIQANPKRRMTTVQALNHPWIAKHNDVTLEKGELQDNSGVGVTKKLRRKGSLSFLGNTGQRKFRSWKSML